MKPKIESREEAAKAGKVTYESTSKCGRCGSYERYVSSSSCAPCIRKSTADRHAAIRALRKKSKKKRKAAIKQGG